jgi:type II secretory pathway component GspD/PulD (secretin)
MTLTAASAGRHLISACLLSTLTLIAYAPRALAQDQPAESKPAETKPAESKPASAAEPQEYRTFYLVNTTQQSENDVQTDLRNMLPRARIFSVNSIGAITIRGTADELQLAQRIIADIDRPAKTYRLTFTLNESDASKPAGSGRIAMVVEVGGKSEVKQGSKIPIVTGSFDEETSKANTQVQYEDVGLNIEAWLDSSGDGLRLRTKIAQSSVSEEKSNVGIQDPVLRQSVFDGSAGLVEGKPTVLGTLDAPNGAGKLGIEVVAELVK